jgi:TRAP-type C4-dicarboxylate transport system permease large subunit
MQLTGAKWVHFFPVGIACGVLTGVVGFAVTMAEGRKVTLTSGVTPAAAARPRPSVDTHHAKSSAAPAERAPSEQSAYRKFGQLCIFAVILMISIALISYVAGAHTIAVVSVAALVYPVLWMGLLGRLPVLYREFKNSYLPQTLPNLSSEVTLFAAAGMFATALTYSGLGKYVPRALSGLAGGNILLLTIAVVVLSVALAAVGVHPIVTVAVFGGTMRAASLGVTPTYLAMMLAICWAIGLTVSPSSATIIATASLAKESPMRVGTRWNGVYAVVSAMALITFITILRLTGLL